MECNICESDSGELAELRYKNGDTYEMYLCNRCRLRFISDTTVQHVRPLEAP